MFYYDVDFLCEYYAKKQQFCWSWNLVLTLPPVQFTIWRKSKILHLKCALIGTRGGIRQVPPSAARCCCTSGYAAAVQSAVRNKRIDNFNFEFLIGKL